MTTTATAVGKFVWHEQVSSDPGQAKEFYSGLFGWGTEVFKAEGMDYEMINANGQNHGGFGKAQEAAPHRFLGAETAASGDSLHRIGRGREELACRFDPHLLDGAGRRHPHLGAIMPDETALAHAGASGKRGNRKVFSKFPRHPAVQFIEGVLTLLQAEHSAELRLTARALQEDHQIARHGGRGGMANIVFDHGE